MQHAVPDISHCCVKFHFQNTHISQVSISKIPPAIFLHLPKRRGSDLRYNIRKFQVKKNYGFWENCRKLKKCLFWGFFSNYLNFRKIHNLFSFETFWGSSLDGCLFVLEDSRKSPEGFSRLTPAKYVCFENETSRNHAKYQERQLQFFSKFVLCSLAIRHHSIKLWCNSNHHWRKTNFWNEKCALWYP